MFSKVKEKKEMQKQRVNNCSLISPWQNSCSRHSYDHNKSNIE